MIKLIDILKEAKQAGPLYHFTSIKYLKDVINLGLKFEPNNSTLPQHKNTWMAGDKNWKTSSKFPELFEERIISKKPGYLIPSYILQIDTIIPKEDIDDELLDKVNIVNSF